MTGAATNLGWRPRGKTAASSVPAIPVVLPPNLAKRFSAPKKKRFVPSPQQAEFYEWIDNGTGSCILEAVAGAGKTSTLLFGLPRLSGSVFFGAYSRLIADEIKKRAAGEQLTRPGLYLSTMHGVGYSACIGVWPKTILDDDKTDKQLSALFTEDPVKWEHAKRFPVFIKKMVSFGKQYLIGCRGKPAVENETVWLKLVQHFSVDQDLPEDVEPAAVLPIVIETYRREIAECPQRIDFNDMIFAPIFYEMRFYQNDWVLVDEAQDINPARRELARRLLKKNGRAIFVGDSRQAIYGFTGAGGDSLERISEEFHCSRLPLTVTYRCPKQVVNYVRRWVSHIEAHPDAPEGCVRQVAAKRSLPCSSCSIWSADPQCKECGGVGTKKAPPWFLQDPPSKEDAILCRYTRPLIVTAYSMIKEGIACKVEGRDIGAGLATLAQLWKIKRISVLEERLEVYLAREVQKARALKSAKREEEVTDKVETLRIFIDRCKSKNLTQISDLVREIHSIFADNVTDCLTLSTGHKAKGREWNRVWWLQHTPRMTSGRQPWEQEQETNIQYVIGTRAKETLVLVPEDWYTTVA